MLKGVEIPRETWHIDPVRVGQTEQGVNKVRQLHARDFVDCSIEYLDTLRMIRKLIQSKTNEISA